MNIYFQVNLILNINEIQKHKKEDKISFQIYFDSKSIQTQPSHDGRENPF